MCRSSSRSQYPAPRRRQVTKETNNAAIEHAIGQGQVEELIQQAQAELSLAQKVAQWKAWGKLEEPAPQAQWKWP